MLTWRQEERSVDQRIPGTKNKIHKKNQSGKLAYSRLSPLTAHGHEKEKLSSRLWEDFGVNI
jgi:hypothetical protein